MEETFFVVKSEDGTFLNKKKEWVGVDGKKEVLRMSFRDQAINELVEVNLGDPLLRAHILELNEETLKEQLEACASHAAKLEPVEL